MDHFDSVRGGSVLHCHVDHFCIDNRKGKRYPVDEELRKRDRRIKELEEENAILKKAMAIFAKDGK